MPVDPSLFDGVAPERRFSFSGATSTFRFSHNGKHLLWGGPGGFMGECWVDRIGWSSREGAGVPAVTALLRVPQRDWLVAGDTLGSLWCWQRKKGVFRWERRAHSSPIYEVAASPDGELLLSVAVDGDAALWTPHGGRRVRRFRTLVDGYDALPIGDLGSSAPSCVSLAFSPQGERALVGSAAGVELLDLRTGENRGRVDQDFRDIFTAEFTPDGAGVLIGARHTTDWDGSLHPFFPRHATPSSVTGGWWANGPLLLVPGGEHAVTGTGDGRIRVWDLAGGEELRCWQAGEVVCQLAVSARHVATVHPDGEVRLWAL